MADETLYSMVYDSMKPEGWSRDQFYENFHSLEKEAKDFFREAVFFIDFIKGDDEELAEKVRLKLVKYFNECGN